LQEVPAHFEGDFGNRKSNDLFSSSFQQIGYSVGIAPAQCRRSGVASGNVAAVTVWILEADTE
jgi:hypothetical protein